MRKTIIFVFLAFITSLTDVNGFLWDKEVEIVKSDWWDVVVVVHHVEYIGVADNGTLECSVPGFTKYRWTIINKASKEGYAESFIMQGVKDIPEAQSYINIGVGGLPLVNDLMVVSCEALLDLHPRMQMIWVITRLHSPMGYPTDPRVCDYGSQSFNTNCTWYQWTYKTDCYYDKGVDYSGGLSAAKHQKCKYWHMRTGVHSKSFKIAQLLRIYEKGGHNYCRNIPVNPTCYLKKGKVDSCRETALNQPWCYSDDDLTVGEYTVHYCKVRECSSCIYGNGDGTFPLYPNRKFPPYMGRSITTVKTKDKRSVLCFQGLGWQDNVCRAKLSIKTKNMNDYHTVIKPKPHCYVAKPGADREKITKVPHDDLVELAECKLPQCTVRQVWFLFFSTFGQPFILESNFKGVKIVLVRGRKEERIKFGAFGIHFTEGLTLGSDDYRVSGFLSSFKLHTRRPPSRLSELVIRNIRTQYSGKYFIQYKFSEADPKIDKGVYKANFELEVKEPTSFSLRPSVLKVCFKGSGKLTLAVKGHFEILDDTLEWKYGSARKNIKTNITPQNTRFELTANAKGLAVKSVTSEVWVSVKGSTYSGHPAAIARVTLKDQPFLKPVSPTMHYVLPGDDVTLIIETDQLQKAKWVFDAMVIASLPDDPDMGFRRVPRGDSVVTSLVISDVKEHHYGSYYVEAILDGCKSTIQFDVKHSSENPEEEERIGPAATVKTPQFNRTGLWCTDELDRYAFYFSVDYHSLMTIGALRNEPLSKSKAVEVQHYTIGYSMNKKTWTNYTLKGNTRIPYVFLRKDIQWLPVPFTARHVRLYPEKLGTIACMRVRLFGCKGRALDCDEIKDIGPTAGILGILIGAPLGSCVAIAVMVLVYLRYKRQKEEREAKLKRCKRKERRQGTTSSEEEETTSDEYEERKGRTRKRAKQSDRRKEKRYRERDDSSGEYRERRGKARKQASGSDRERERRYKDKDEFGEKYGERRSGGKGAKEFDRYKDEEESIEKRRERKRRERKRAKESEREKERKYKDREARLKQKRKRAQEKTKEEMRKDKERRRERSRERERRPQKRDEEDDQKRHGEDSAAREKKHRSLHQSKHSDKSSTHDEKRERKRRQRWSSFSDENSY